MLGMIGMTPGNCVPDALKKHANMELPLGIHIVFLHGIGRKSKRASEQTSK
jgi:hypothetical protein